MNKFLIYMIGRSGSGKTTLANALAERLHQEGMQRLQVIDGDVIRRQFGDIFGYTYEERMKCNQAVRVVVKYLLENDISVILAQVAAYEEMRVKVRESFEKEYIEVYVQCSYEECAKRDVKGYYKKVKNGEMNNLNGANDIYEVPKSSDIVINTEKETIEEAIQKIITYLKGTDKAYKYITNNNLYEKQTYMYSEYKGEDFIKEYVDSRREYLDHQDQKINRGG